jgi:hypothetical protein
VAVSTWHDEEPRITPPATRRFFNVDPPPPAELGFEIDRCHLAALRFRGRATFTFSKSIGRSATIFSKPGSSF